MGFIFLLQSFLIVLLFWLVDIDTVPVWFIGICILLWPFMVSSGVSWDGSIHETEKERKKRQQKSFKSAKFVAKIYTIILIFLYLLYFIGDY